jgi:hypothetical protein
VERRLNVLDPPTGGAVSGYSRVRDEGVDLTQRTVLDFGGRGVTASDLASRTFVDIPGVSMHDEGSFLTYRSALNFIGAGVNAADNGSTQRTDVTIPGIAAQDEGSAVTYRSTWNFVGSGVTVSDVSSKTQVNIAGPSIVQYITTYVDGSPGQFQSGWANAGSGDRENVGYWTDGVVCHLQGSIKKTTTPSASETMFILPASVRPILPSGTAPYLSFIVSTSTTSFSSYTPGYVEVYGGGDVIWMGGYSGANNLMSLNGIYFRTDRV